MAKHSYFLFMENVYSNFHIDNLTLGLFLSAKVVDLDSCLSKKPLEEKISQPYSARESMSEIQSLSSFQSESCDDNGR